MCVLTVAVALGCGSGTGEPSDNDVDLAAASTDVNLYCLEKTEANGTTDVDVDAAVDDLVRIYREDPEASYENQLGNMRPAREVLADAATDLHECGRHELAGELERALDAGP